MRTICATLALLLVSATTAAAQAPDLVVLPRPGFPAPAQDVQPGGSRLELVSSRYVSPATSPPPLPPPPSFAPKRFRGAELQFAIRGHPHMFFVYGGRYLVKATNSSYAIDFVNFLRAPNGGWAEEIRWTREARRVLYVSHAHLTYATATRGRNAYVSAIDLETMKTLWRSPALVANARSFVVARDVIVSGYGFTAESDFLYLLDRKTGRVLDRLQVPSAPEVIKLRGDRLHVRTYDRQLVVRIARR